MGILVAIVDMNSNGVLAPGWEMGLVCPSRVDGKIYEEREAGFGLRKRKNMD